MRGRILIIAWLFTCWCAAGETSDPIAGDLVGLNVSLAGTKQLSVCDQLIACEEWDAAIDLLEKLRSESPDSLVQSVPGTYLGMKAAIQQRLCSLPDAGRALYRKRFQSTVQNLWQRGLSERDDAALQRIVEDFAASSLAAEATDRLASRAAQRGDVEAALRFWSRLRPLEEAESPDPLPLYRIDSADHGASIHGKWLSARSMAGLPLTDEERSRITDPRWSELLEPPSDFPIDATPPGDLIWSTMATENSPVRSQQRCLAVNRRGEQIVLNNGSEVRVLNVKTGEPFWPTVQPVDTGRVYQDASHGEIESRRRELPCRLAGGIIERDRYFGVLGDQPRWAARTELIPRTTELFCLDLGGGEGRTLWRAGSRDLPAGWQFHGAPRTMLGLAPGDDLVVVPICRPERQVELGMAAFRQDDGVLSWWTRIGIATAEAGQPIPETHGTSCGGVVILRSLTGVVAAIHSQTGTLQWATTELVSSPIVQRGSAAPLIDARVGRVAVAEPARGIVAVLSVDSGELIWARDVGDQLMGVTLAGSDRLLVSGRRLQAYSLRDGSLCWEHGSADPLEGGTGVPAVEHGIVCWPTRTSLWGLDLRDGTIRFHRQHSASPRGVPMQVLVSPEEYLLTLPDELAVFEIR